MIDIMGGAGMTGQQSFSEQNKNQWQTVSMIMRPIITRLCQPQPLLYNRQKINLIKLFRKCLW